jgi:hypothetical protein
MASLFVQLSGYKYVKGNPLSFNDPTGMAAEECPTCPKTKQWQEIINSEDKFTFHIDLNAAYMNNSDGNKALVRDKAEKAEKDKEGNPGIPMAVIGMMAEYGQGFSYSKNSRFHNTGWRDFRTGNRYGHSFYGNQYTTTPRLSKNSSLLLNITGKGLGVIGYASIIKDYRTSVMINPQSQEKALLNLRIEAASNTISTFGSLPGAAWGIGWETGRVITQQPEYRKFVNSVNSDYRRGGNDGLLSTDDDW